MSLLAVPIISIVAFVTSILCLIVTFVIHKRHKAKIAVLESQVQTQELFVNSLQSSTDNLSASIHKLSAQNESTLTENTLVSKQLEHRIKSLQAQINTQQDLISQLQTDQGEDKFYTRAIKLAKIGSDIDEIVAECELPRAEVEMLISVYQKKTQD